MTELLAAFARRVHLRNIGDDPNPIELSASGRP
jgi:hypothetical protein